MIFLRLSFKSLIFLYETFHFEKIVVQIFDFPFKNKKILPGCVIQICVSDKLQIPPNDPLDTFGSESAFASKGFVLKMSLSERPPFSKN